MSSGPVLRQAVEAGLQRVLALGIHPAQIDGEDADAVALHHIGGGARHDVERRLGGRIGGEVGWPAMGQHGGDVDDGAGALRTHHLHRLLHHEIGRAGVDAEQALEGFGRRVVKSAALGVAGGIDQHVQPAEGRHRGGDGAGGQRDVDEIALEIVSTRPSGRSLSAASRSFSPLRSSSMTPPKPVSRNVFAAAKPMPCSPPVTSAILFQPCRVPCDPETHLLLGQRLELGKALLVFAPHRAVDHQAGPAVDDAGKRRPEAPGDPVPPPGGASVMADAAVPNSP